MQVKLVVLEGKAKDREIPLPSTQFVIGRATACHLRPHSGLASKFHCAIGRKAGQVIVRDLNSRNGTFVNDKQIHGTMRVKDGDVLAVGPLRFRIAISASQEPSPVQAIREDHVRWLMEASDAFDMDSSYDTQIAELPAHLLEAAKAQDDAKEMAAESSRGGDSKMMSAGEYLKEYFRPKKQDQGTPEIGNKGSS